MALQMFVNPLPGLKVQNYLQFDYPANPKDYWEYRAEDCLPNINIEPPGLEQLYSKIGSPAMEQGHPCIREWPFPEEEDPKGRPYQDQVLDFDRQINIHHTGRLSGSFVKYIAHDSYFSKVKIYAHPIAPIAGTTVPLNEVTKSLTPAANSPNVWFWKDPSTRNELLYTAHVIIEPKKAGLKSETVYKLICKWEFWDHSGKIEERMPISGFDEAVTFEVISATENM
jgi:hypothetical protein